MKTLSVDGVVLTMDDDVFDFLKGKKIEFTSGGYPILKLHTMFFPSTPDDTLIDHINRDKGDFRRENLRHATYSLNNRNKSRKAKATSRFKGLKVQRNGSWAVEIFVNGKGVFLGRWVTEAEAARCYDIAQIFFFPHLGAFNFPAECYAGVNIEQELQGIISKRPLNNRSGFRGVFSSRNGQKWYARYGNQQTGTYIHLGTFDTREEASRARDEYAKTVSCRNTRLNSPSWERFLSRIGVGKDYPPACSGA